MHRIHDRLGALRVGLGTGLRNVGRCRRGEYQLLRRCVVLHRCRADSAGAERGGDDFGLVRSRCHGARGVAGGVDAVLRHAAVQRQHGRRARGAQRQGQADLVWTPDAAGSVAFLISGYFVLVSYRHVNGTGWAPKDRDWWSGQINFLGCVAFGVSAVASYITSAGVTVDAVLANTGTLVGAVCFFLASAVVLPKASS